MVHRPAAAAAFPAAWLAAGVVAVQALAFAGGSAWAQDPLAHGDRTASLYREVVKVDGAGNPLLPVSVLSRQDRLEVAAPSGLRILGTGDGQVELRLPPGTVVEVVAAEAKPGIYQHYVVLGEAPAHHMDALRKRRAEWKDARGVPVRTLQTGTTYSLAGRMLDTRKTLVCLQDPLPTAAVAQARADALERQYGEPLRVHTVVDQPPSATLVARAPGGVELRAADVLWLEAATAGPGAALRIVGHRGGVKTERDLPGRIYVVPAQQSAAGAGGGLEVVNEAEIERILPGVVASEIFHSAPDAALRAQAVAARTDMLAKVGTRHGTDPFAICSEVHCQAYFGVDKVSPRIAQAVADTRGLVLSEDGQLIDAYYHAVSGGHTENNENAWAGEPQKALRGQADGTDKADPVRPRKQDGSATDEAVAALLKAKDVSWAAASGLNPQATRWSTVKTAAQVHASLAPYGIQAPILAMRVLTRGVSGRATALELTLKGGTKATLAGELRIRRGIGGSAGPSGLRSSLFLVTPGPAGKDGVPGEWRFEGAGFGHGVGMDQTGAVGRAKAGQDFKAILGHYYAGAKVEKLY